MPNAKTPVFLNCYHCEACKESWEEEADCGCDDRCPSCNKAISPLSSEFQYYIGESGGLSLKDKMVLRQWLRAKVSIGSVLDLSTIGLVENVRFSERTRDWYVFLWKWSAFRFSNLCRAEMDQEAFTDSCGVEALKRRIARVNKWIEQFIEDEGVSPDTPVIESAEELRARFVNEHPYYGKSDWALEATNDDTVLGYWEWVSHKLEESANEAER